MSLAFRAVDLCEKYTFKAELSTVYMGSIVHSL